MTKWSLAIVAVGALSACEPQAIETNYLSGTWSGELDNGCLLELTLADCGGPNAYERRVTCEGVGSLTLEQESGGYFAAPKRDGNTRYLTLYPKLSTSGRDQVRSMPVTVDGDELSVVVDGVDVVLERGPVVERACDLTSW